MQYSIPSISTSLRNVIYTGNKELLKWEYIENFIQHIIGYVIISQWRVEVNSCQQKVSLVGVFESQIYTYMCWINV